MRSVLAAVLLLVSAAIVSAQSTAAGTSPEGTWVGSWVRDGSTVDITMRFAKIRVGFEGSFDSEGLRVIAIPMQKIVWEKPKIRWEVTSDSGTDTYEGVINGALLTGRFKQGGATGTFSFRRMMNPPVRPGRKDITFMSGGVMLAGTILVPAGKGKHPGIVFLHGSGAEGRWASNYLAEAFALHGFAALIFDKRGVGKSGGDWQQAGFDELAADAAAAVSALSAEPYVAPGKVGIHGHSQGGTLAPMAASRIGHPAFVIASAASGMSMRETEIYSVENSIGVRNLEPSEAVRAREFVKAIVGTAFDGKSYESARNAWLAVRDKPWAFELPPQSSPYWTFSKRTAAYDPIYYWRQVSAPTLLVYGEADERIPPRPSAERIAEAYLGSKGTNLRTIFFPAADHTFRVRTANGNGFAWPKTVRGYPDAIVNWAVDVVR